jgi:hypothetical protein
MKDYLVTRIPASLGKEFVREHHYSHGIHNGPMCWGLYDQDTLIGVCAFATPNSENVRASIFGPEYVNRVTELHRLVIVDDTPKNTESWFITRAMKALKLEKPHLWAVISFADQTEGHKGTIYQATNALYYGTSNKARFYLDNDGRLRHPRQNGMNITLTEAESRGWKPVQREGKHRYLFLLPDDKRHLRQLRQLLKIETKEYPNA